MRFFKKSFKINENEKMEYFKYNQNLIHKDLESYKPISIIHQEHQGTYRDKLQTKV